MLTTTVSRMKKRVRRCLKGTSQESIGPKLRLVELLATKIPVGFVRSRCRQQRSSRMRAGESTCTRIIMRRFQWDANYVASVSQTSDASSVYLLVGEEDLEREQPSTLARDAFRAASGIPVPSFPKLIPFTACETDLAVPWIPVDGSSLTISSMW